MSRLPNLIARLSGLHAASRNVCPLYGRQLTLLSGQLHVDQFKTQRFQLHGTAVCCDLNEFFDSKENWGKSIVKTGRPYRLDELRLKSNSDLHKLWYVLLKERNMLMTMEDIYRKECQLFPSPERLEKVEDSMENILDVIRERDIALSLLETGDVPNQTKRRWTNNILGIGYWRKYKEHRMPIHLNPVMKSVSIMTGPWLNKYKMLYREQLLKKRSKAMASERSRIKYLRKVFPHRTDLEPDVSQFEKPITRLMKGPSE